MGGGLGPGTPDFPPVSATGPDKALGTRLTFSQAFGFRDHNLGNNLTMDQLALFVIPITGLPSSVCVVSCASIIDVLVYKSRVIKGEI